MVIIKPDSNKTNLGTEKEKAALLREYDRLSALSCKSSQEASRQLNSILYKPQSELLRNHEEDLSQSLYRQMIETGRFETNFEVGKIYYYCKIHPNIWRTDLVQIEGHCKNEHGD